MKLIGLTGGIGSGKSFVGELFAQLGVPVYEADAAARRLQESDELLKAEIRAAFGDAVFDANGQLDRKKMAAIVFADPGQLKKLNALVHPAVKRDFTNWVKQFPDAPYVIRIAAILFESGAWKDLDEIINVTAPEDVRMARVQQRDTISREDVQRRMQHQLPEEERNKRASRIIVNDGKQLVLPQVVQLHELFSQP